MNFYSALSMGQSAHRAEEAKRAEMGNEAFERKQYAKKSIDAFKGGMKQAYIAQQLSPYKSGHPLLPGMPVLDQAFEAYLGACNGDSVMAQVAWEENFKRLWAQEKEPHFIGENLHIPLLLKPEDEDFKAFLHFVGANKEKKGSVKENPTIPRFNDWENVFALTNNGKSELVPGIDLTKALTCLVTNYDVAAEFFESKKEEVQEVLKTGNLVIIANHCTWLNLPMVVSFLHEILEIPLANITTLLGPALNSSEEGRAVSRIGNTLETVPDTGNGRMEDFAPKLEKQTREDCMNWINDNLDSKKSSGQVLIVSPSGSSDRENKILEPSKGSKSLINLLQKRLNCAVWPIATDTTEVFPKQLPRMGKAHFAGDEIYSGGRQEGGAETPLEGLYKAFADLHPKGTEVIGEEEWDPTLEVIGQGNFGKALVTALEKNTTNSVLEVAGISGDAARERPGRGRHKTLVLAVPSAEKESIVAYIQANKYANIVLTAKGPAALEVYHELDDETKQRVVVLSGPNKADQITNGEPSAAVIAGTSPELLDRLHGQLGGPYLRLYTSESPNVIQLSGVLKNLIVLELGKVWWQLADDPEQKTKLLMQALRAAYSVIKKEAPEEENPEEFWGIAGLGDILLCLEFFKGSTGSRNFKYGQGLGFCGIPEELKEQLGTVEGVPSSEGWQDESLAWLATPEMDQLKEVLAGEKEAEALDSQESAKHMKVFTSAFTVLEDACVEMGLNENTRAWAFCRLHKELQVLFPDDCKNEILHAMCEVVLSDVTAESEADVEITVETEVTEKFKLPEDISTNKVPMLRGLEQLSHGKLSIKDLKEDLLGRQTKTEGFEKKT